MLSFSEKRCRNLTRPSDHAHLCPYPPPSIIPCLHLYLPPMTDTTACQNLTALQERCHGLECRLSVESHAATPVQLSNFDMQLYHAALLPVVLVLEINQPICLRWKISLTITTPNVLGCLPLQVQEL